MRSRHVDHRLGDLRLHHDCLVLLHVDHHLGDLRLHHDCLVLLHSVAVGLLVVLGIRVLVDHNILVLRDAHELLVDAVVETRQIAEVLRSWKDVHVRLLACWPVCRHQRWAR